MFSRTPLLGNKQNSGSKNGQASGIELTPFGQQSTDPFADKFFSSKYRWKTYRQTKTFIFNFLEDPKDLISKSYHSFVILSILVTLGLAISLSVRGLDVRKAKLMHSTLSGMEGFLACTFLLEYILRLWSCSAKGTYTGCSGLFRYMIKPHMILDLMVILASLVLTSVTLGMGKSWEDIRYLMPLQLVRILRIDRQRGAFKTFHTVITKHYKELLTCWYMGFIVIMFLSYLVYAEPAISGDHRYTGDDLANSLYWGIVSMTTIGYGDILPKTGISKLLLCVFALVGTGFIALPAGIIGSGFALQVIEIKKQKQVRKRRRPAAILIQSFWKLWASDLARNLEATWIPHVTIVREVKEGELPPLFTCAAETFQKLPGTNLRYKQVNKSGAGSRDGAACGYVVYKEKEKSVLSHKYCIEQCLLYHVAFDTQNLLSPDKETRYLDNTMRIQIISQFMTKPLTGDGNTSTGFRKGIATLKADNGVALIGRVVYDYIILNLISNTSEFRKFDKDSTILQEERLNKPEKLALGFIRHLKFIVALKRFRQTKRPLDEKDIMDQFSGGQVEIFEQLKQMDKRLEIINESKAYLEERVLKIEHEMKRMAKRHEEAILILEKLEVKLIGPSLLEIEDGKS